jgi:dihydrofolate reductase
MGRLVVSMFSTLDGVMQGPGGIGEDEEGGFPYSGWQVPFGDAQAGAVILDRILHTDALLLGRKTYDIWVRHWPHRPAGDVIADRFNAIPKFVASRTLTDPTWAGTSVVKELATEVPALTERFDTVGVWGSSELLPVLFEYELVDRLDLWVYPIALGTGKRVFGDGTPPTGFELDGEPRAYGPAVLLPYRRGAEPTFGTFD